MDKVSTSIRIRLSIMMFLQYMMFAVWWVPLAAYLANMEIEGAYKAWILSVMPLGCLLAPVFCMVADRHFASQKVLTVLNFGCALLFFLGARQTNPAALFVILLLAMFCYMPTWSLTNAIAMANYPSDKFPQIRVFGSIGWVACAVFSLIAATSLFGGRRHEFVRGQGSRRYGDSPLLRCRHSSGRGAAEPDTTQHAAASQGKGSVDHGRARLAGAHSAQRPQFLVVHHHFDAGHDSLHHVLLAGLSVLRKSGIQAGHGDHEPRAVR